MIVLEFVILLIVPVLTKVLIVPIFSTPATLVPPEIVPALFRVPIVLLDELLIIPLAVPVLRIIPLEVLVKFVTAPLLLKTEEAPEEVILPEFDNELIVPSFLMVLPLEVVISPALSIVPIVKPLELNIA